MTNINELKGIKSIDVETPLDKVVRASGTFTEILQDVMVGRISALTNKDGNIVGMNYETGLNGYLDSMEQRKFELKFSGNPIMDWVLGAMKIKANNQRVVDIHEDGNNVSVVLDSGEVIKISEEVDYDDEDEEDDEEDDYEDDNDVPDDDEEDENYYTPENMDISYAELEAMKLPITESGVKKFLRRNNGHYLCGNNPDLKIDFCEAERDISVTGIKWGRKIYSL